MSGGLFLYIWKEKRNKDLIVCLNWGDKSDFFRHVYKLQASLPHQKSRFKNEKNRQKKCKFADKILINYE